MVDLGELPADAQIEADDSEGKASGSSTLATAQTVQTIA